MEVVLSKTVRFWQDEISLYERTFDKWVKRGRKIQKRYKDIRSPREEAVTRFNVLWANVQTRLPALYARDPKPEVERRFKDRDPVGRVTSEVLERSLDYTIRHCNPFGRLIRQAVLDYELPGRGTVWIRYVPHFHKPELVPNSDADNEEEKAEGHQITDDADSEPRETLSYEETQIDYVFWEDYGHTYARTEEEIRGKWRRVYLTREELAERFELEDEELDRIPMEWSPKTTSDSKVRPEQRPEQRKAIVYEIWDKQERKALWLVKNYPEMLDEESDPLGLEGFFPCPPPLYANLVPDEMIPTPNFTYYQDQASEIDELSTRIAAIGKALKVAGVRDTSAEGLDRLLSEGVENQLIPVDGWIALKEKGGLAGVMELLPLKEIAEALGYLREQRQQLIDDIYQITGLSDIIRGLSDPNETATAQQIKGQFSVLRISDAQSEVQRFCRDVIRICAEIIAGYDLETLKQISGVKLLTRAEKEALNAQLAAAQSAMPPMPGGMAPGGGPAPQPGAPGVVPGPQGPPGGNVPVQAQGNPGGEPPAGAGAGVPAPGGPQGQPAPEVLKLLKEPSWEDVGQLLSNKVLREFRIDIETDSTIRMDEESEKQARMEFLDRATNFIASAAAAPAPMIPAIGEVFLFAVRGFKVARNLERTFEDALEQMKNQPPRPDPEMMKVQAKVEGDKQIAQIKSQADMQVEQHKQSVQAQQTLAQNQAEDARKQRELAAQNAHEAQLEQMKQEFEGQKVAIEKASAERIAAAKNATDLEIARMNHAHEQAMTAATQQHEAGMAQLTQGHERAMAEHQARTGETTERVKGEEARKTESVRGETAKETEKVKGDQAERIAKVKPKAEAQAAADGEKDKQKPMLDALEKLQEAIKEARKPRKIVKKEDGTVELH